MKNKLLVVNQINSTTAEILLYGAIGTYEGDISSIDFVKELRQLEAANSLIYLRINSPGGDVYEGIAMYNAIKQSKCAIHTYIDGIAASMACIIALSGSKVYMSMYARIMTHKPSTGCWGNCDDMAKAIQELNDCEKVLNAMIVARTGLSADEVTQKYLNGTDMYFSADAALKQKLVDSIYDAEAVVVPEMVTDNKDVWRVYQNKFDSKLTAKANPTIEKERIVMIDSTGVVSILTGLPHNLLTLNTSTAISFPDELYLEFDELMRQEKLSEMRLSNYTAYAVVYDAVFDKLPIPEDKIDQSLFAKYKAERVRYIIDKLSKMDGATLMYSGQLETLRILAPALYQTKLDEYLRSIS
jgi:ATP-dependent Clp endopeptidase proteolytic subunit ClpP